jgi:two-component system, sensor histidine kinase YesM
MKKLNSFSSKLMILFTFSIIIPIIVMTFLLCNYFFTITSKQNIQQFENTLDSLSNNINTYSDDLKRLTLTPYLYNDIFKFMEYLSKNNSEIPINTIDLYKIAKSYSSTLNKLINQSRKDILGITFIPYSNTDTGYTVSKYYDTLNKLPTSPEILTFIPKTIYSSGDAYFTPVHTVKYNSNGTEYKVFSLMRTVKNLDNNKIIGIIKVDAKESTLKEIISSIKVSPNSKLLLLDESKQIIYSSTYSTNSNNDYIYDGHASPYIAKDLNLYNIVSKDIQSNNWQLLYLGSKKDLYSGISIVFLLIFLIVLFFFIATLVIFKINSKKMVFSVKSIISTMGKFEIGDLSARCEVNSNSEFKYIADSLNKMAYKLDLHIKNEYKAIINQKNAEYLALQSQINPHFLCNILNDFIALNRLNEKKLLEDSLIQLSKVYRYTCKNSNIATLEEELSFIEKYLNLEIIRFDDLLEFKIDIDTSARSILLPKLILQPLVENSIKHGIGITQKPILIEVISAIDKSIPEYPKLILTVSDNGPGFDINSLPSNNSTGLNNVKERLKYYQEDSIFEISSIPNKGTKCYIEIPLRSEDIYAYTNS